MGQDILLQTSGSQIVTPSGRPVLLRGIGLGGWIEHGELHHWPPGRPRTLLRRGAPPWLLATRATSSSSIRFLDVLLRSMKDAAYLAEIREWTLSACRSTTGTSRTIWPPSSSRRRGFKGARPRRGARRPSRYLLNHRPACPHPAFRTSSGTPTTRRTWSFFWTSQALPGPGGQPLGGVLAAGGTATTHGLPGYNAVNEPNECERRNDRALLPAPLTTPS